MRGLIPNLHLSISTRLALWFGLSLLLLLSIFVVFLYVGFHVGLHRDFQAQLDQDQARALDLVRISGDAVTMEADGPFSDGSYGVEGTGGTYLRLLSRRGELLHRSANIRVDAFTPRIPDGAETTTVAHVWEGAPARSVYTPLFALDGELLAWMEVTRLESELHNELHRLGWLLAVGVVLAAATALAAGNYLARRALRPVAQITEASRQIQSEDLDRRVPANFGVRDELTELAETLNALLDRLAASFERERQFRADAAHEMFTPLSAIQSEVDVTLRRSRSDSEYKDALKVVEGHARQMKDIVEDLLELSRAEALSTSARSAVDLSAIVSNLVARFESRAAEHGVTVRVHGDAGVVAPLDRGDLEKILSNLLENAIKYTPEGGRVEVSVRAGTDEVVVSVSDTGVGFSEDERRHLFDRFYRASGADGLRSKGSGLGLSIVRAIVSAYGGEVRAMSRGPGLGSRFDVILPGAAHVGAETGEAAPETSGRLS